MHFSFGISHLLRQITLGIVLTGWPFAVLWAQTSAAFLSQFQAQPDQTAVIKQGEKAAFLCSKCHGEKGLSPTDYTPNLAGQNPEYLVTQIEKFATSKRQDEWMEKMIRSMAPEERAAISLFYAAQHVTPASLPTAQAQSGQVLFEKNCARCHENSALGKREVPRLAGQQPQYLRKALLRYLEQHHRNYPPMTAAVIGLGKKNIDAVVAYLSALNPPVGTGATPGPTAP